LYEKNPLGTNDDSDNEIDEPAEQSNDMVDAEDNTTKSNNQSNVKLNLSPQTNSDINIDNNNNKKDGSSKNNK